jgi:hypothetical protein
MGTVVRISRSLDLTAGGRSLPYCHVVVGFILGNQVSGASVANGRLAVTGDVLVVSRAAIAGKPGSSFSAAKVESPAESDILKPIFE